jgi:hypothetical protein
MTVRISRKQREHLKELEQLARRTGLRVSYGDLRFGGLRLKGGQCLFRGERWLVLDRKWPYDDQLDLFLAALALMDIPQDGLSPDLTKLLQRRSIFTQEKGASMDQSDLFSTPRASRP